jgi:hypothetical protein
MPTSDHQNLFTPMSIAIRCQGIDSVRNHHCASSQVRCLCRSHVCSFAIFLFDFRGRNALSFGYLAKGFSNSGLSYHVTDRVGLDSNDVHYSSSVSVSVSVSLSLSTSPSVSLPLESSAVRFFFGASPPLRTRI